MTAHQRTTTRRALVLAVALLAALAFTNAIAPDADAAKPNQILSAEVRSVNMLTCEVMIDTHLNRRGSMKNDIVVTVSGGDGGFVETRPADRGATIRVERSMGAGGTYQIVVSSRNPRTGEVSQTIDLGSATC